MLKRTLAVLLCAALLLGLLGCGARDLPRETGEAAPQSEADNDPPETPDTALDQVEDEEEAESLAPPPAWVLDSPENHGMDADLLDAMHEALGGTTINSVVIVRDGVIVDEFYQEEYDEDTVFRFNSCSKSVTSTLIGIAIDEGLIEGVNVPISTYFPQLAGTDKGEITIRDLLEHRSGLEWYEFGSSAVSFWELNEADNWVDYVLERPLVAASGTTFNYTTGGTHLLAAILEQACGEPMLDYARSRLFEPLGMDSVYWRIDPQGIPDGGNGVEMTTRDAARFGQLLLDGGALEGRQLVPAAWVEEATGIQVERYGISNGHYGYQWWIMTMAGYDTFYALGAGGQFIVMVPELNLVAAITSGMPSDTNLPYSYLANYILAAC